MSLAASLPSLLSFLLWERKVTKEAGAPLLNLEMLARPAVSWALLTLLIATGTYYALLFTLAQYLQAGLGASAFVSGITLVPWSAAARSRRLRTGHPVQLIDRARDAGRTV